MSKWYPQRTERELLALTALENAVKHLTNEFQGKSALNFYNELELAAYLVAELRRTDSVSETTNGARMHLAHLEWPCVARKLIDLVIWQPGTSTQALDLWGDKSKLSKELPLLAAVQIKRGPGDLTSWVDTEKDTDDLETLYASEDLKRPVLYFLEWVDHDLRKQETRKQEEKRQRFREVQSMLKEWCGKGLYKRALVVSRDKVGFAYPERAWLVNPLPSGVIENLY